MPKAVKEQLGRWMPVLAACAVLIGGALWASTLLPQENGAPVSRTETTASGTAFLQFLGERDGVLTRFAADGETVLDEILTIEPHEKNASVKVSCVVTPIDEMPLLLTEISSEGSENDYMLLYNPNDHAISTVGYMLSDIEENPKRFVLPARTVEAGETLKIYCDNNTDFDSFHQIFAPFNLKVGETVYFSRGDELLQSVFIPDLRNTSTYVLNLTDGEFYEEAG